MIRGVLKTLVCYLLGVLMFMLLVQDPALLDRTAWSFVCALAVSLGVRSWMAQRDGEDRLAELSKALDRLVVLLEKVAVEVVDDDETEEEE